MSCWPPGQQVVTVDALTDWYFASVDYGILVDIMDSLS